MYIQAVFSVTKYISEDEFPFKKNQHLLSSKERHEQGRPGHLSGKGKPRVSRDQKAHR